MNRRTSVYTYDVPAVDPNATADEMLTYCYGPTITGAGVSYGHAYVRIRVADDISAMSATRLLRSHFPDGTLHTGVGIHRREVTE